MGRPPGRHSPLVVAVKVQDLLLLDRRQKRGTKKGRDDDEEMAEIAFQPSVLAPVKFEGFMRALAPKWFLGVLEAATEFVMAATGLPFKQFVRAFTHVSPSNPNKLRSLNRDFRAKLEKLYMDLLRQYTNAEQPLVNEVRRHNLDAYTKKKDRKDDEENDDEVDEEEDEDADEEEQQPKAKKSRNYEFEEFLKIFRLFRELIVVYNRTVDAKSGFSDAKPMVHNWSMLWTCIEGQMRVKRSNFRLITMVPAKAGKLRQLSCIDHHNLHKCARELLKTTEYLVHGKRSASNMNRSDSGAKQPTAKKAKVTGRRTKQRQPSLEDSRANSKSEEKPTAVKAWPSAPHDVKGHCATGTEPEQPVENPVFIRNTPLFKALFGGWKLNEHERIAEKVTGHCRGRQDLFNVSSYDLPTVYENFDDYHDTQPHPTISSLFGDTLSMDSLLEWLRGPAVPPSVLSAHVKSDALLSDYLVPGLLEPISDVDEVKLQAIQDDEETRIYVAPTVSVSHASLRQLIEPDRWVNEEGLTAFHEYLNRRENASFVFTANFFSTLLNIGGNMRHVNGDYQYRDVRRWPIPADLFQLDKVFFPLHKSENHWVLVAVFMKCKRIQFYDSRGSQGVDEVMAILMYLMDVHRAQNNREEMKLRDWKIVLCDKCSCPQQRSDDDCGVFCSMFIDRLIYDEPLAIHRKHCDLLRKKMALAIITL